MKGNEQSCICEKPKGKHRKSCDAYRLSEFLAKAGGIHKVVLALINHTLTKNGIIDQAIKAVEEKV